MLLKLRLKKGGLILSYLLLDDMAGCNEIKAVSLMIKCSLYFKSLKKIELFNKQ
jgi:hypothetical protein